MTNIDKPAVRLVGEDGNVFNIIGRVSKALKDYYGQDDKRPDEFRDKAYKSQSYDEVLQLVMEYVEVE